MPERRSSHDTKTPPFPSGALMSVLGTAGASHTVTPGPASGAQSARADFAAVKAATIASSASGRIRGRGRVLMRASKRDRCATCRTTMARRIVGGKGGNGPAPDAQLAPNVAFVAPDEPREPRREWPTSGAAARGSDRAVAATAARRSLEENDVVRTTSLEWVRYG